MSLPASSKCCFTNRASWCGKDGQRKDQEISPKTVTKRLRNGHETVTKRLGNSYETVKKRLRNGWETATKRLRSGEETVTKRI